MATVTNKFYVTSISDGSALSAILHSTGTLTQVYNNLTGQCVPDWSVSAEQPIVFATVRVNGELKRSSSSSWYYNGELLVFDPTTHKSTNPNYENVFQEIPNYKYPADTGIVMPAVKIIDNLAVKGNTDNDVISLNGAVEMGGTNVNYSVSLPIRISMQSSSGYLGTIYGDSTISSASARATMHSKLYNGGIAVTGASKYYTKWYREGRDTSAETLNNHRVPCKVPCDAQGVCDAFVEEPDIDDNTIIRVEFYDEGDNKVYTCLWNVDDETDPYQMYIGHGTSNQNNASLREGEKVTFIAWMARNTDSSQIDASFNKFELKVYNSENSKVNVKATDESGDKNVISDDSSSTSEYIDITEENVTVMPSVTAAKAGVATIKYEFAHSHGDSITGIVKATGSTSV